MQVSSLESGEVAATTRKYRDRHPYWSGRSASKTYFRNVSVLEPPRCGDKGSGSICLLPQPPLLTQEGTPASATSLQPETPNTIRL